MIRMLDVRGHLCPIPLIRAGKELSRTGGGMELEVISDDPAIVEDLPSFCRANGHEYLGCEVRSGVYHLRVRSRG
jgi:TusA-related sulfurtransferase